MSTSTYQTDDYDYDGSAGPDETPRGYREEHDGGPPRGSARRRRVALVVVVVAVLAVALTWVVAFSSLFGVRSIDVRGNHVLTSAQVVAAADIARGTPLVRIDTAAARRRVEALPEISSAEVDTSFPSSVVISVHERTPVGYLRTGSRATLVDRTGLQYRTVASAPSGLPRFVVPTGQAGRSAGVAVAGVATAIPASLRSRIDSIEALDPNAITLVLSDGRIVRWGSATRSADKARVLPALLKSTDGHIDVTDPDRPFTH